MPQDTGHTLGILFQLFTLGTRGILKNPPSNNVNVSYGEALERTASERIETTTRKRQLGFTGTPIQQGDSTLPKRIVFGRLAVQRPKRGGRLATSWGDCLQKKIRGLHGDPAQRLRTEMGRIRSCCQGWTGSDDCCEERGHVAPGGRERSGNTR